MKKFIFAFLSSLMLGIFMTSVGFCKPFEKQKYDTKLVIEKVSVSAFVFAGGDKLDPGNCRLGEIEYIEFNYSFIGREPGETPYSSPLELNNKPKGNRTELLDVCRSNC